MQDISQGHLRVRRECNDGTTRITPWHLQATVLFLLYMYNRRSPNRSERHPGITKTAVYFSQVIWGFQCLFDVVAKLCCGKTVESCCSTFRKLPVVLFFGLQMTALVVGKQRLFDAYLSPLSLMSFDASIPFLNSRSVTAHSWLCFTNSGTLYTLHAPTMLKLQIIISVHILVSAGYLSYFSRVAILVGHFAGLCGSLGLF